MFTRDEQIALLESMEQRLDGYMQAWLANPAFKAALHRYDREDCDGNGDDQKRRAVG